MPQQYDKQRKMCRSCHCLSVKEENV